jgi:hypothetical protein
MKDALGHGSDTRGASHQGGVNAALSGIVMRRPGEEVGAGLDALTQPGHVYRGMSGAEYNATVGAGKGVQSNLAWSIPSAEGTNFAEDAPTAESYANYGRTDPRVTGEPNYLVEVKGGPDLERKRDGYYSARASIPQDRVSRVWRMANEGGAVVGRRVK